MQSESERAGYGGSFITVSIPPGSGKDADYDNSKRRRNTSIYRVSCRISLFILARNLAQNVRKCSNIFVKGSGFFAPALKLTCKTFRLVTCHRRVIW